VNKKTRLPKFLNHYFWDINTRDLDPAEHADYVIKRIMEYGNPRAVLWMLDAFPKPKMIRVLSQSRGLSPQSANFWACYFGVSRRRVLCLKKSYSARRKSHWPY